MLRWKVSSVLFNSLKAIAKTHDKCYEVFKTITRTLKYDLYVELASEHFHVQWN